MLSITSLFIAFFFHIQPTYIIFQFQSSNLITMKQTETLSIGLTGLVAHIL